MINIKKLITMLDSYASQWDVKSICFDELLDIINEYNLDE